MISILIIMTSGCILTPEPPSGVPEKDVKVNDIWIWFVVEWGRPSVDSYLLIPTLTMEDGTILAPIYDRISEGHGGDEGQGSNNISIVDTDHGWALRYNVSGSNVYPFGSGEYRSAFTVPYILGDANIVFNTTERMKIQDRFFKDGPGFSIWEERWGKVRTSTYIDDEANWIRLYLERRGDMTQSHSWGVFDCYKGITYETSGTGWFNIELERRTSFPMM
jgi:hypothetical protein